MMLNGPFNDVSWTRGMRITVYWSGALDWGKSTGRNKQAGRVTPIGTQEDW